MIRNTENISLRKYAVITGLGIMIMALTVPLADLLVFPKLIDTNNAKQTCQLISANRQLFVLGIAMHFIAAISDIIAAWGLYNFLKPVDKNLSLLVAWFRLVYTGAYLFSLGNLIKALGLLDANEYFTTISKSQINDQILFYVKSFRNEFALGLILFGIFLILLGYLATKADYIPKILGWILIFTGVTYIVFYSSKFLFPAINLDVLVLVFLGELVFMGWLLIKGGRNKEQSSRI